MPEFQLCILRCKLPVDRRRIFIVAVIPDFHLSLCVRIDVSDSVMTGPQSECQHWTRPSLSLYASYSLWTTVVQSLVVCFRDPVDVCPVGFPDMRGADDFNCDAKGGEPSEELGTHCDIHMSKKVLIIHLHDHNVLAETVNDNADKFASAF